VTYSNMIICIVSGNSGLYRRWANAILSPNNIRECQDLFQRIDK
jgi:hypothetical protein